METTTDFRKATFLKRFLASFVDDIIILVSCLFILVFLSLILKIQLNFINLAKYGDSIQLTIRALAIIFNTLFIWRTGQTPGKKLLKIKVIKTDNQKVTFWQALLRESIGKLVSSILFSLGYFWMLIDSKRQTWHDKIAQTYVVEVDQKNNAIAANQTEAATKSQKLLFGMLIISFTLLPFMIFIIIYSLLFRPYQINGRTMSPNYIDGQYYLASLLDYRFSDPNNRDVIVFNNPLEKDKDLIKRIIAIPGEKISIKEGKVILNGSVLDESKYLPSDTYTNPGSFIGEGEEKTVPENMYFVLGDNRNFSMDSREFGYVSYDLIVGKVLFCYYKCELNEENKVKTDEIRISPTVTVAPTVALSPSPILSPATKLETQAQPKSKTANVTVKYFQWKKGPEVGATYWSSIPVTDDVSIQVNIDKDGVRTTSSGKPPSWSIPPLSPGTYTINATDPPGHTMRAIRSAGIGSGNSSEATRLDCTFNFTVEGGEDVILSCWFDGY